jgi:hypothetical protein
MMNQLASMMACMLFSVLPLSPCEIILGIYCSQAMSRQFVHVIFEVGANCLATGFENGVGEMTSAHLAVSCLRALKAMVLSFAY